MGKWGHPDATAGHTVRPIEALLKRLRMPFKYQLLIPMVVIMTAVLIFPLGYSFALKV